MGDLNGSSLPATRAALRAARQQRVDLLRRLVGQFMSGRRSSGSTIERGRWLALALGSVGCAALVAHRGSLVEVVMAAIALASLVSSIAGFAFSGIAGAMLFHLLDDPVQVVRLMITCSIANQAMMTWDVRHDLDWRGLLVYLSGGMMGLALGVWVLLHADRTLYGHAFGALLLAYSAYMLFRRPSVVRRQHAAFDLGVGFLGGLIGGAAAFPGAPVAIWCGMKGWHKTRQRGVVQPFILVMQVVALLAISLAGRPGSAGVGFDAGNLLFIPASLLGTSFGMRLYTRLSDSQFARAVNILLLLSGLSFVM